MARGPQAIAQPGGSVTIPYSATAASIQTAIDANPGATTFWIEKGGGTGVRAQTAALIPKTGNTFVFEFGAILDGSGWTGTGTNRNVGAFQAHNQNIDTVTITNATIRNMPQRGVHSYQDFSSGWTIEYCEIHHCFTGIEFSDNGILRKSYVHHCIGNPAASAPSDRGGAWGGNQPVNVLIEDNQISYCGPEQKLVEGSGHIFRLNDFDHNYNDIWVDGDCSNITVEDNTCTDTRMNGIVSEFSETVLIQRNTVTRAGLAGVFLGTSKNCEVTDNDLVECFRGITLFLDCGTIGGGAIGWDLADNNIHGNRITLSPRAGALTSEFSYRSTCGALTVAPYVSNAKNNLWIDNVYTVPTTGPYWYWGVSPKTWAEWQAIPQDAAGMTFPSGSPSDPPGTGGDIGTGGGGPAGPDALVFSCYEQNAWKRVDASDGTAIDDVAGTPIDPFPTGTFGMGRLDNGRIWIAPETYFTTVDENLENPDGGAAESPVTDLLFSGGTNGTLLYKITTVASVPKLVEIDPATWTQTRSWTIASVLTFPNIAANPAATFAYYASAAGPVKKLDLTTGTESTFLTNTGVGGILTLSDGSIVVAWWDEVKRYNAAGTELKAYGVGGFGGQGNLSPGLPGRNSLWIQASPTGAGRVHMYEVEVDTEAVLADFEMPEDGTSYDSPYAAVVGAPADDTPPDEEPPVHVQPPTPLCGPVTNLTTVAPNPGCNAGGVGWVPEYTGDSGKVPEAVDPVNGEPFTGKDGLFVDVEVRHRDSPDGAETVYRWAAVDLDDEERKKGCVISFGRVDHGSSDGQGNAQAATIAIRVFDEPDREVGTLMAAGTLARDEVTVRARSDWGRRTGAVPHQIGRGIVDHESYGTPVAAHIGATDPLFDDAGVHAPDKKVPQWTFPTDIYFNAPPDVSRLFMPVIFGEVSDEKGEDPATGLVNSRGKCPWRYVGMDGLATGPGGSAEEWGRGNACLYPISKIISVYGSDLGGMGLYGRANATSNGASPSTIALGGSPDLSGVPNDESTQIVFFTPDGIKKAVITGTAGSAVTVKSTVDPAFVTNVNWYIAPADYQPRRIKIDLTTRNGDDVMVPKWPGYIRPKPWEELLGGGQLIFVTDFWVRGPLLDAHLAGECTIAFNAIGVEENGDTTGRPIIEYFTARNFYYDNMVHIQRQRPPITIAGGSYWPQTDGDLPAWSDGVYKTRQSDFARAQARTVTALGGVGLEISAYFGYGTPLRDIEQAWNDNGACWSTANEWCQMGVWNLDETEDPTLWPRIEHVSRVFGDITRTRALDEAQNAWRGSCDWDPDGDKYREELIEVSSPEAIARNKGYTRYSKHVDGRLIAKREHFEWVLQQRLALYKDGPIYVRIENADAGLFDHPVGTGIQLTSQDGPGALGFVDQPLVILSKSFDLDKQLCSLVCLDVSEVLIPLEQQAEMTDDDGDTAMMTDDPDTSMIMV